MTAKNNDKIGRSRIRKMFTKKRIIILLIILGVIFAIRQFSSSGDMEELETLLVAHEDLIQTVSASGQVKAERSADLVFVQPGDIEEIYIENGQRVAKGTQIARIDTTKLYQTYLQAEAALRAAEATLARVYDDIKADGEDFEEREERTSAETAKDQAYRAFVIAQINFSQGSLIAPFDGVVSITENTSIGSFGTSAMTAFIVSDPSTVYFESEVDETDVNKIKEGLPVLLELDAFRGEIYEQSVSYVSFVNSFTSSGGTVYKVGISMPENIDMQYRIGMNGNARFVVDTKHSTLSVPDTAIVLDNGTEYVWIIENGKARKQTVETGVGSEDSIEILSGISEGQTVVVRPPAEIEEGASVKIED